MADMFGIDQIGFGRLLRSLREQKHLPLWKVASTAMMDSTLLSKIEVGARLPTSEQTAALAKFFGADALEFESMRIAEKFLLDNADNGAAVAMAIARIHENAMHLSVNRKRVPVKYRARTVNKSTKKR
jgi:transcriptional regulator with XRE-family HTH domain